LRVFVTERKVLQLALYPGDAEPVGHGSIDIKSFLGDAPPLCFRLILKGAHIVKAVRQLDQNNPDVVRHGEEHLSKILRLAFFLGLEIDLADLGNTVNEVCNLGSEDCLQLLVGCKRIFQGVMQQTGSQCLHVQTQLRQNGGHFHGMNEIWFAGKAGLPLVNLCGKDVGLPYDVEIRAGVVGYNFIQDVIEPDHRYVTGRPGWNSDKGLRRMQKGRNRLARPNCLMGLAVFSGGHLIMNLPGCYLTQPQNHVLIV